MAVDLVDQPGFVAGIGQENPDQVDDIVTADDQSGLVAAGIKFGEFLAQERQQQTDREGERAAGDQAGMLRGNKALAWIFSGRRSVGLFVFGFILDPLAGGFDVLSGALDGIASAQTAPQNERQSEQHGQNQRFFLHDFIISSKVSRRDNPSRSYKKYLRGWLCVPRKRA